MSGRSTGQVWHESQSHCDLPLEQPIPPFGLSNQAAADSSNDLPSLARLSYVDPIYRESAEFNCDMPLPYSHCGSFNEEEYEGSVMARSVAAAGDDVLHDSDSVSELPSVSYSQRSYTIDSRSQMPMSNSYLQSQFQNEVYDSSYKESLGGSSFQS